MASFNKVILIGNMTADPELKQTLSGISACTFSIAVNRKYKDQSGKTECDFFTIVAWRQQAEFVTRYFKKGMPILICGQLQTRTWTDNQGNKRYATDVIADEVAFVNAKESSSESGKNDSSAPSANEHYIPDAYASPSFAGNSPAFEELPTDESLPF